MRTPIKNKWFKPNLLSLLLCLLLFTSCLIAAPTQSRITDDAHLLTSDEVNTLNNRITTFESTYDMDVFIVTTQNAQGKTAQAYADDFFFNMGYGTPTANGILLLIDMDNRQVYISTSGSAINYFTDKRIDLIIDAFYGDLKAGDYSATCKIFLKKVDAVVSAGIPTTTAERTSLPRGKLTPMDIAIRAAASALIAAIVAIITYISISYSYKHPRYKIPATLPDRSTTHYTSKKDRFTHTHTSSVRIQTNNNSGGGSSGGGSSTHSSSGGGTFGGGGRGF